MPTSIFVPRGNESLLFFLSSVAEERLELAQYMMEKKLRKELAEQE